MQSILPLLLDIGIKSVVTPGTEEIGLSLSFDHGDPFRVHFSQQRVTEEFGTLTGTSTMRTAPAADAEFHWQYLEQPAPLTSDAYQMLWRGEWVRDGEVVKQINYAVRLSADGEQDIGGFVRGDPAADRVRPLITPSPGLAFRISPSRPDVSNVAL